MKKDLAAERNIDVKLLRLWLDEYGTCSEESVSKIEWAGAFFIALGIVFIVQP